MHLPKHVASPNIFFLGTIFLVTQVIGVLLSLVICFVVNDFTWGFVTMALINSFLLGLGLMGGCILTQRLVFRMKTTCILVITTALVLGIGIVSFLIVFFLGPTVFIYYNRGAFAFLLVNALFILGLNTIASGMIIYGKLMVEKERALGDERTLKNRMELQLLSSRVNPHFLFNTLNMILNLLKKPELAEIAILNLSDLLRENLEQSENATIPIGRELESVGKYLEIQKLRFGDRLRYTIRGDAEFSLPPLIIQPLVENSIKHNMSTAQKLTIEIQVSQTAGRHRITVIDSQRAVQESMIGKGQGLTITKKRVEGHQGIFQIRDGGIEISFSQ